MENVTLPETFRPLLWSHDFERIDPLRHKKTIVVQTDLSLPKDIDTIRIEAFDDAGASIFGAIDQTVIAAGPA